jgi:hypothetical protein
MLTFLERQQLLPTGHQNRARPATTTIDGKQPPAPNQPLAVIKDSASQSKARWAPRMPAKGALTFFDHDYDVGFGAPAYLAVLFNNP